MGQIEGQCRLQMQQGGRLHGERCSYGRWAKVVEGGLIWFGAKKEAVGKVAEAIKMVNCEGEEVNSMSVEEVGFGLIPAELLSRSFMMYPVILVLSVGG